MRINKIIKKISKASYNYINDSCTTHIAFIDEKNCIGCIKCLHICPADAIIGAKRVLHTIVKSYCTGCDLCIAVCPTDCITSIPVTCSISSDAAKTRYHHHFTRTHNTLSFIAPPLPTTDNQLLDRKKTVTDAIARAQAKRTLFHTKLKSDQE